MPPFSAFDHERNKLWVTRASTRKLIGPFTVQYYKGDGELVILADRMAVIMSDSKDGIVTKIYSPTKKRIEQGGADQPATAPLLKSEGKDKPQPESKVRPQ